jgi:hypothetical protein
VVILAFLFVISAGNDRKKGKNNSSLSRVVIDYHQLFNFLVLPEVPS